MSVVERRYHRAWLRPTEDEALARLGHANKKPRTAFFDWKDSEINRLLTDTREGRIGNRDFWRRRSRILKGEVL